VLPLKFYSTLFAMGDHLLFKISLPTPTPLFSKGYYGTAAMPPGWEMYYYQQQAAMAAAGYPMGGYPMSGAYPGMHPGMHPGMRPAAHPAMSRAYNMPNPANARPAAVHRRPNQVNAPQATTVRAGAPPSSAADGPTEHGGVKSNPYVDDKRVSSEAEQARIRLRSVWDDDADETKGMAVLKGSPSGGVHEAARNAAAAAAAAATTTTSAPMASNGFSQQSSVRSAATGMSARGTSGLSGFAAPSVTAAIEDAPPVPLRPSLANVSDLELRTGVRRVTLKKDSDAVRRGASPCTFVSPLFKSKSPPSYADALGIWLCDQGLSAGCSDAAGCWGRRRALWIGEACDS
jgi:hypothetical protein